VAAACQLANGVSACRSSREQQLSDNSYENKIMIRCSHSEETPKIRQGLVISEEPETRGKDTQPSKGYLAIEFWLCDELV
jgi:hypothetical protein